MPRVTSVPKNKLLLRCGPHLRKISSMHEASLAPQPHKEYGIDPDHIQIKKKREEETVGGRVSVSPNDVIGGRGRFNFDYQPGNEKFDVLIGYYAPQHRSGGGSMAMSKIHIAVMAQLRESRFMTDYDRETHTAVQLSSNAARIKIGQAIRYRNSPKYRKRSPFSNKSVYSSDSSGIAKGDMEGMGSFDESTYVSRASSEYSPSRLSNVRSHAPTFQEGPPSLPDLFSRFSSRPAKVRTNLDDSRMASSPLRSRLLQKGKELHAQARRRGSYQGLQSRILDAATYGTAHLGIFDSDLDVSEGSRDSMESNIRHHSEGSFPVQTETGHHEDMRTLSDCNCSVQSPTRTPDFVTLPGVQSPSRQSVSVRPVAFEECSESGHPRYTNFSGFGLDTAPLKVAQSAHRESYISQRNSRVPGPPLSVPYDLANDAKEAPSLVKLPVEAFPNTVLGEGFVVGSETGSPNALDYYDWVPDVEDTCGSIDSVSLGEWSLHGDGPV